MTLASASLRGVADKFSSGCDQYRHRERARVPGTAAGWSRWGCVIARDSGLASYLLGSVPVGGLTVRVALVQAGDVADACSTGGR